MRKVETVFRSAPVTGLSVIRSGGFEALTSIAPAVLSGLGSDAK